MFKKKPNDEESWILIKLITFFTNVLYFGIGAALFVVGVLYLTAYFYEYSFSAFNPTLVAALFVPFGITIACLGIIFCKKFILFICNYNINLFPNNF